MKAEFIYDMMLFHTYSKFSGFLVNLLGLTVIIIGGLRLGRDELTLLQACFYFLGGFAILGYTPFTLKRQAKRAVKSAKYSAPIYYSFDDNGIVEEVAEANTSYAWTEIRKAIATPKDIVFYISETDALIMPKESFGDSFMPIMQLVFKNMSRERISIR